MARLPLIDPETTSGDMRASFDRMPIKLNVFRMLAHAETNFARRCGLPTPSCTSRSSVTSIANS
jgi:hypothetical protein